MVKEEDGGWSSKQSRVRIKRTIMTRIRRLIRIIWNPQLMELGLKAELKLYLDMMRVNSLMLGSSTSPTSDFSFCASLSALLLSVWERQVLKLWNFENFDNAKKVRNPFKHLNMWEWPVKIHRSWIHCQGQLSETSQQPMMMRSLGNNQRRGEGTPAVRSRLLLKKVSTDTVLSRIVSSYFSYRSVLLLVCGVVCVVVRFIIMTWVLSSK